MRYLDVVHMLLDGLVVNKPEAIELKNTEVKTNVYRKDKSKT